MDNIWTILGVLLLVALALAVPIVVLSRRTAGAQPRVAPPVAGVLSIADLKERYMRPAFMPLTKPGDEGSSHFCGRPWLRAGETWPECGVCSQPLQMFLQLDLDHMPNGAPPQRSGGLAQLFYCTAPDRECEIDARAWAPRSRASLARVVDPREPGGPAPEDLAPSAFDAQTIVGWEEHPDLPDLTELRGLVDFVGSEVEEFLDEGDMTLANDKLGGWPHWVQDPEYPQCPECGRDMELLFQIESQDHVPHMFGDMGCGHVMRCPTHSTRLAFSWACT